MAANKLVQTGQHIGNTQKNIQDTSRYVAKNLPIIEKTTDLLGTFYPYMLEFKSYGNQTSIFMDLLFYPRFGKVLATQHVDAEHEYVIGGGSGTSGGTSGGGGGTTYPGTPPPPPPPPVPDVYLNDSIIEINSTYTKEDFIALIAAEDNAPDTAVKGFIYDTIEFTDGTYNWSDVHINVDRTARPLTIRTKREASHTHEIIFDGGGASSLFTFGDTSLTSYIQFEGPFIIQNYVANPALITTKYVSYFGFHEVTVRSWSGGAGAGYSYALYISSDGTHSASNISFSSWTILAPTGTSASALRVDNSPTTALFQNWSVTGCFIAGILEGNGTGITISSWIITNCTTSFVSHGTVSGSISGVAATGTGYADITNTNISLGGGNSGLSAPIIYPSGIYPPNTTLTAPPVNGDSRPGYLSTITDSTWTTKIMRITNTQKHRNQYSTHQSWNLDGTRMYFPGYGGHLYDGVTYADLGYVSTSINYGLWSNLNANYIYGIVGATNVFARYNIATSTQTTLHTFAGYSTIYVGNYDGNMSDNDRVVLVADNTTIIVYDIPNNTIISSHNFSGADIDNAKISHSGNYVTINYNVDGSGSLNGLQLYSASTLSSIRRISTAGSHSDCAKNANGEDIYTYVNANGTGAESHRMSDGQTIFLSGGVAGGCHISGQARNRPGWVYISSSSNAPGVPGNGQIFAVKTDGSRTVEVFGFHHHGAQTDYDSTPFASPNRDGSKVTFGGAWGGSTTTQVFGFVAGNL